MPCYFYKNQFSFLILVLEAEFVLNLFLFREAFLYYCFARFPGFYNILPTENIKEEKKLFLLLFEVLNESKWRRGRSDSSHKVFFAELWLTFLTFLSEVSLLTVCREHVHTVRLHTRINNSVFKKSNVMYVDKFAIWR